jgi:wyosine [tRNA(Phe)-imidazoG37] synthetase (radical SAM superfamily)
MDEFSKTRSGMKLLNIDLPAIAKQLERIAEGLEKKNQIEEKRLVLEHRKYIREGKLLKGSQMDDIDDTSDQFPS